MIRGPVLKEALSCRSLLPYLVDMLQHPSAGSRGAAAGHLARLAPYASETVATALLRSPDDCLGSLLKYLASEDSLHHRAHYALLMGVCAQEADSVVMKKISDAGAALYLLVLLKQADTDEVKGKTLTGLAVSGCCQILIHSECVLDRLSRPS